MLVDVENLKGVTVEMFIFFILCFQSYFEFLLNLEFFFIFSFFFLFFYCFGQKVCPEGSHLSGLTKGQKQKRQLQISMVTNPQVPPNPLQWSLQPIRTRTKTWHCCRSCVTRRRDGLEGRCITRRRDSGRLGRIMPLRLCCCSRVRWGTVPLQCAVISSLQHV